MQGEGDKIITKNNIYIPKKIFESYTDVERPPTPVYKITKDNTFKVKKDLFKEKISKEEIKELSKRKLKYKKQQQGAGGQTKLYWKNDKKNTL